MPIDMSLMYCVIAIVACRFLKKMYMLEVSEAAHVGDYLGVLEADSRLGVVFSILGDSRRNPFAINPASGIISLDKPVDFEDVQAYNFTVLASSMVSIDVVFILFSQQNTLLYI